MNFNSIKEFSFNQRELINTMCEKLLALDEAMEQLGLRRITVMRWMRNRRFRTRVHLISMEIGRLAKLDWGLLFPRAVQCLGNMIATKEINEPLALICVAIIEVYVNRKRHTRRKKPGLEVTVEEARETMIPQAEREELLERIRKAYEKQLALDAEKVGAAQE